MANDKLMKDVVNYLNNQRQIDTFITESVDFSAQTLKVHSDNIIDMRYHSTQRVSRASPGVNPSIISNDVQMACYLHEEKIEIQHEPGFWEKFTGFFKEGYKKLRFIDRVVAGDYVDALQVAGEHNAALFKLGSGSDLVNGYQEKPNIFQMADG
uniref:Uncharacterized protein n=1 Tax=Romanomermis culicivorax TaxID=13658 RepID=A0A915JQ16_ROMCU